MADENQSGLDGEQPLQSLKDELPGASGEAEGAESRPTSAKSPSPFQESFRAFAKFGDSKADGKQISLSQSDKWMKQAKVIDGKKITSTDTGIYFKKLKSLKLGMADYQKFLAELAKAKNVEVEDLKKKLVACGPPGTQGTTAAAKTAAIDRLTDSTKYTGSHKMRFDESGRGRGIDGRKDPSTSAYVQGYANKDSYDKTH